MKKRDTTLLLFSLLLCLLSLGAPGVLLAHDVCQDGVVYDDDRFEQPYTLEGPRTHFAMRLDPSDAQGGGQVDGPALLTTVCLCFLTPTDPPDLTFDLLVWDDDGIDGAPGTLLGKVEGLTAEGVRNTLNPPGFYLYDVSAAGIAVSGSVYVGPSWDNPEYPNFNVCADESSTTPRQPAYSTAGEQAPAEALEDVEAFASYRALGIRAEFLPLEGVLLEDVADLIVPGYAVDTIRPQGPNTFLGLRNTSSESTQFELEFHGNTVTTVPLRTDLVQLSAGATYSSDVRSDLTDLEPNPDGIVEGVLFVRRDPNLDLAGDYFRVDFENNFASGDRLVRPSEFCNEQEIRYIDFGSGTKLQILLNLPRGDAQASFRYTAVDQSGALMAEGEYFTDRHINVIDIGELGSTGSFGTVVFDFSNSFGGWVGATYSAFELFSVELNAACRDE